MDQAPTLVIAIPAAPINGQTELPVRIPVKAIPQWLATARQQLPGAVYVFNGGMVR